MVDQRRAIWITVIVTAIAAILGLLFAGLVGTGITRPVRLLLQGTRDVEAGQLDRSIDVVTRDEIGQLTAAFNRMVGQLRHKEQIRRTCGRYIDPRVVEGLINQSAAATEGQRRVMTVMFCDMKGFTGLSESMTVRTAQETTSCLRRWSEDIEVTHLYFYLSPGAMRRSLRKPISVTSRT
jgi:HAMP domain-containing protein